MSTFDRYLQGIIDQASVETERDRSAAVEAHHLLLAIATEPDGPAHDVLAAAGLDHDMIVKALNREYAASLNVAGVSVDHFQVPPASPALPSSTAPQRLGTSSMAAIRRIAGQFRKSELGPAHLLLGIMQAQVGIVPRALDLAGVDRAAILARLGEAIDAN